MHLSRYFQTVHAIDVSQGMIDYAREHILSSSVMFYLSDGLNIPLRDNSVSAVFSTHVFQHFNSLSHATAYFCEIYRVLTPGSSLMIHLPVYNWPTMPGVFDTLYGFRKYISDIKAWAWRHLSELGIVAPPMRGLQYSVSYLYNTLTKQGFTHIEISFFAVRSNGAVHPCVFARKPVDKLG
jgi:ubiquinone/menaquinone biosynthesis C-methylase UbiE